MTVWDTDVAVVGSGFGGGVAALRHAEAGRSVVVLEQGRRLSPADLTAGGRRTRDLLWMPKAGLRGYFQQSVLRHVIVVHGVGVGGGSIVYAAVLLRPGPEAWRARGWTSTAVDWATELDTHFDAAAGMLRVQLNPQIGLQDRWLASAARELGAEDTYGPTPQGISFDDCIRCGACITGCPHGAKNSVDRTYLALGIGATAHILGGAVIAGSPDDGVVDTSHRVFATPGGDVHEDLRVLDGSVVPVGPEG
jgi:cholesterol oxidase